MKQRTNCWSYEVHVGLIVSSLSTAITAHGDTDSSESFCSSNMSSSVTVSISMSKWIYTLGLYRNFTQII